MLIIMILCTNCTYVTLIKTKNINVVLHDKNCRFKFDAMRAIQFIVTVSLLTANRIYDYIFFFNLLEAQ